jgi:hypothetical protein
MIKIIFKFFFLFLKLHLSFLFVKKLDGNFKLIDIFFSLKIKKIKIIILNYGILQMERIFLSISK